MFLDFLFEKPFGLAVSDAAVAVVHLKGKAENPQIQIAAEKALPPGFVQNGQIQNPQALAGFLKSFFEDIHLTAKKCVLSLPWEQSFWHLSPGPLPADFDRKIKEMVPLPPEEIEEVHGVLGQPDSPFVFGAAASRSVLKAYGDVLQNHCGIKPVAMEPAGSSLLRSLQLPPDLKGGRWLFCRIPKILFWFLLWEGAIFDSHRLAITPDFLTALKSDLKNSKAFFEKTTGKPLLQALVLEPHSAKESLMPVLKDSFAREAMSIPGYRLSFSSANKTVSDILLNAGGAALRGLGVKNTFVDLNLFQNYKAILAS